jgi:hypothetical protein
MSHREPLTLIVDEIPGLIAGNPDEPPGHVMIVNGQGRVVWEITSLKMPYDIARASNGNYLVNIIRARAVWEVAPNGEKIGERPVGGYPCSLELLPENHILVAGWDDHLPGFVREFDGRGKVVWGLENLCWPWKAQRLPNGNTLIADAGKNRVFEVGADKKEVWAVENLGPETPKLFDRLGPVYCQRLNNNNTLISIRGESRIVELDPKGNIVWSVERDLIKKPYSALRLPNGNTLIADGGHSRVIEMDKNHKIVWEKGGLGYPAKAYRL